MSDGLKHKMYNYEAAPPAKVWDKIAEALDESEMQHEFPSKLYGIEMNPPDTAWEKIRAGLDTESPAPSRTRKLASFVRYAAAVVLIGLIAFGSIQLFKGRTENKKVSQQQIKTTEKATSIPTIKEEQFFPEKNIPDSGEKGNDAALEESKHTFARLDLPSKSKIKIARAFYFGNSPDDHEQTFNQQLFAEKIHEGLSQPDTKSYLSSRYITLLTPDGNLIRMSKKLIDLACCISGEEQDANCKDLLQRWREKIACAPVNASPANFMDIFGLVNSLQDNNE